MSASFCPDCEIQYPEAEEFCCNCGGLLQQAAVAVGNKATQVDRNEPDISKNETPVSPAQVTPPANESVRVTRDEPNANVTDMPEQERVEPLISAQLVSPVSNNAVLSATDVLEGTLSNIPEQDQAPAPALSAVQAKVKAKLDSFLRSDKAGDSKRDAISDEDPLQAVLPLHEREANWRIVGDPYNSRKGYEQWPVEKNTSSGVIYGVFRRYTTGVLTTEQTYQTMLNATAGETVRLYSYGTVQMGAGARADYEICAAPAGQPLNAWLKESANPGLDQARYLAPLLAGLLKRLQAIGLRPITLDPSMLYISAESGIILSVLGALAPCGNGDQFFPDLANSGLLTLPFAAPELIGRRIIANTTETFAVGQILSEALFGDPQDHEFVTNGSVAFAAIGDPVLEALLMGTLWPQPDERWSVDQLNDALVPGATELSRPAWRSLRAGAAKGAFSLGGKDYFLPEDLFDNPLIENWDEAVLQSEQLLNWLKNTRFKGQAQLLRQQLREGRSVDWMLLRLRHLIVPDAPIVWRDYALDDDEAESSLISLAQRALGQGGDATRAQQDLNRLLDADLRGAFTVK